MSRKPILAGNWKMHKTSREVEDFFQEFNSRRQANWDRCEIMFAVPYTLLALAKKVSGDHVKILAQNVHHQAEGAFTGEISTEHLRDLDLDAALVGHSERRQYFAESDESVGQKVARLTSQDMTALACVGESQQQREAGETTTVVKQQISAIFSSAPSCDHLIVAYEPVWAIGTGLTASDEQAEEVHSTIRELAVEAYGASQADQLRILYGGSAKPANIAGLMAQENIDGGLVGGASLQAKDFADMIDIVVG